MVTGGGMYDGRNMLVAAKSRENGMEKQKRPWGLTLVAVLLVLFSPVMLLLGVEFALASRFYQAAGATAQGVVTLVTGILILKQRKNAVYVARICAILFTIACAVHGLSPADILQIVLVWAGFVWYRNWRARGGAPRTMVMTEAGELAQKRRLESFLGMARNAQEKD